MHHAVLALGIAAGPSVGVPVGLFHHLPIGLRVALVEQVAGSLPAKQVVGRRAPRPALQIPRALEELQEHGRLVELPPARRVGQDPSEERLAPLTRQKVRLIRRLRIRIAGRDHHPFHAQRHHLVEKRSIARRVGGGEERGVGGHAEAGLAGGADRRHGHVVDALAADGVIVLLPRTVEVHRKRQVRGGGEEWQHLLEFQRVGAEVEIFLAGHDAGHDLLDLRMQQRLPAGNRNERGTAFIHRGEALLGREMGPQHLRRMLDLATATTGEVAAKKRLKHEHERIPGVAPQSLHGHVLQDGHHLSNGHTHATRSLTSRLQAAAWENRANAMSGK